METIFDHGITKEELAHFPFIKNKDSYMPHSKDLAYDHIARLFYLRNDIKTARKYDILSAKCLKFIDNCY